MWEGKVPLPIGLGGGGGGGGSVCMWRRSNRWKTEAK